MRDETMVITMPPSAADGTLIFFTIGTTCPALLLAAARFP